MTDCNKILTLPQGLDTIIQGDCISVMSELPDNCVDLIIADPPYNLSKGSTVTWDRSVDLPGMGGLWSKTNEAWDDLGLDEYFRFTLAWLTEAKRVLKPTGSMWIFGTYHNMGAVNLACQLINIEIINDVVWYKRNAFPNLRGRRLTASHENLLWCHSGAPKRLYFFDYEYSKDGDFSGDNLKANGKQMRTVWDIPNNKDPRELLDGKHPTQKPLRILKRIIQLTSHKGDIMLAPFSGAGSECIAAMELDRHYIGIEIEGEYVELSSRRLERAESEKESKLFGELYNG